MRHGWDRHTPSGTPGSERETGVGGQWWRWRGELGTWWMVTCHQGTPPPPPWESTAHALGKRRRRCGRRWWRHSAAGTRRSPGVDVLIAALFSPSRPTPPQPSGLLLATQPLPSRRRSAAAARIAAARIGGGRRRCEVIMADAVTAESAAGGNPLRRRPASTRPCRVTSDYGCLLLLAPVGVVARWKCHSFAEWIEGSGRVIAKAGSLRGDGPLHILSSAEADDEALRKKPAYRIADLRILAVDRRGRSEGGRPLVHWPRHGGLSSSSPNDLR